MALRICGVDDERQLRALAELDSAAALTGTVLAAEQEGELRAAIALASRRVIADPFHPTADLVELLETRAAQIDRQEATPGRGLRERLWVVGGRGIRSSHAPSALQRGGA